MFHVFQSCWRLSGVKSVFCLTCSCKQADSYYSQMLRIIYYSKSCHLLNQILPFIASILPFIAPDVAGYLAGKKQLSGKQILLPERVRRVEIWAIRT